MELPHRFLERSPRLEHPPLQVLQTERLALAVPGRMHVPEDSLFVIGQVVGKLLDSVCESLGEAFHGGRSDLFDLPYHSLRKVQPGLQVTAQGLSFCNLHCIELRSSRLQSGKNPIGNPLVLHRYILDGENAVH